MGDRWEVKVLEVVFIDMVIIGVDCQCFVPTWASSGKKDRQPVFHSGEWR